MDGMRHVHVCADRCERMLWQRLTAYQGQKRRRCPVRNAQLVFEESVEISLVASVPSAYWSHKTAISGYPISLETLECIETRMYAIFVWQFP